MSSKKILATNKQVRSEYEIIETYEAGIVLTGPEVKSVKHGNSKLQGSYVVISSNGQPALIGSHIAAYKPAVNAQTNYDPSRTRSLLMNKKEINSLEDLPKEVREEFEMWERASNQSLAEFNKKYNL